MSKEILEGLGERLRYINNDLSQAYNKLDEVGAEVSELEIKREDLINEIKEYKKEIAEISKKREGDKN